MKFLIALALLTASQASFAKVNGGKAPVKKWSFSCNFSEEEAKSLEGVAYGKPSSEAVEFAIVKVYRVNSETGEKSKRPNAIFRMNYKNPGEELSLYFEFENKREGTLLEIMGDDMGGMSRLVVDDEEFSLTCGMDL